MEEIWKKIEGYEKYSVSNYGRVRNDNKNLILKPEITKFGYYRVRLKGKHITVHQLVARSFIPYTGLNPDGTEIKGIRCINHKDENPLNNTVDNLEWCDKAYNNKYGTRLERVAAKKRNNPKESKKVLCVETGVVYLSTHDVERKLGFKHSNISGCCNNKPKHKTRYGYHWKFVEED